jgi:hypothetical protein
MLELIQISQDPLPYPPQMRRITAGSDSRVAVEHAVRTTAADSRAALERALATTAAAMMAATDLALEKMCVIFWMIYLDHHHRRRACPELVADWAMVLML